MAWIKRNLLFVVGLAVAVALLGSGVFYLLNAQSDAAAVNTELESKNQEFDTLVNRKPAPTEDNIKLARDAQVKLDRFKDSVRGQFLPLPLPEALDDAAFKNLLEGTLDKLDKAADRSGVKLPKPEGGKYAFTFDEQRRQLQMAQRSLVPLTIQLLDIADLSQILFDAKIHSLESIRRTPVNTNDITPASNYLAKKPTTNTVTGAVLYPYEAIFQCFSSELASALAGFVNAKQAFVVKSINVERGTTEAAPLAAVPNGTMGMDRALAARYGMSPSLASRYGLAPAAAAPSATTTKPGEPVLDDKPLRITLGIEVVKLAPVSAAPAPAPVKPKTRPVN